MTSCLLGEAKEEKWEKAKGSSQKHKKFDGGNLFSTTVFSGVK